MNIILLVDFNSNRAVKEVHIVYLNNLTYDQLQTKGNVVLFCFVLFYSYEKVPISILWHMSGKVLQILIKWMYVYM